MMTMKIDAREDDGREVGKTRLLDEISWAAAAFPILTSRNTNRCAWEDTSTPSTNRNLTTMLPTSLADLTKSPFMKLRHFRLFCAPICTMSRATLHQHPRLSTQYANS
jgi:hypothetical protein